MKQTMVGVMMALAVLVPGAARAGIDNAGTTAANFLSVGSGAGVLGMGGAVIGFGRDLNAVSWNPGALGWMTETQMVLSHAGLADEQAQEWLATGGRFGSSGTRWGLSGLYHGQGTFEGRDAGGAATGSFNVASTAFGAQIAQRFGERATIGFGAKYVSEDLGTVRGSGFTWDAGAMFQTGRFGFGVAAQNVTGYMTYDGAWYPFPANYGVGASVAVPEHGLRFALDANFPRAYYSDVRGGVEWMWRDQFALRTGYRAELGAESGEPLAGPSFGMGAGIGGIWFDYGYLISGMGGGGEHRMGLTLRPGQFGAGGAFGRAADDEPVVPEPARVAPPKKKSEPKAQKTEAPKPSAPARGAAAKAEPAKPEPAKPVAVRPEPMVSQPVKVEAVRAEAEKPAPAKSEPVKAEPAKSTPAKAAPVKSEPAKAEPAKAEPAPKKIPTKHKVRDGETLFSIAKLYGTTVPKIMEINNMVNENIQSGQTLKLPKPESR